MSTLQELVSSKKVSKYEPRKIHGTENECRAIYFAKWARNELNVINSKKFFKKRSSIELKEQVEALFDEFCFGEEWIEDEDVKPITPEGESIWEFRTTDVRIIGWFTDVNTFIVTKIISKFEIKQLLPKHLQHINMNTNYDKYRSEAVEFRKKHSIDFIEGDFSHVITNP